MRKDIAWLCLLFVVFFSTKLLLSQFVVAPTAFSDEYFYSKLARAIFLDSTFSVHSMPSNAYPPIYPAVISISFVAKSMSAAYLIIKAINAVLSSLIIFPAYFLAREFLAKKRALLASIIVSVLPMNFSFAPYVMAENIVYVLVLSAGYFCYKALVEPEKKKWAVLAGIFAGAAILTKLAAVFLVVGAFVLFMAHAIKKKSGSLLASGLILSFIAFVFVAAWSARNYFVFGQATSEVLGQYTRNLPLAASATAFFSWFGIFIVMIALSSGVVWFLSSSGLFYAADERRKLFAGLLVMLAMALITELAINGAASMSIKANTLFGWLHSRPIGRYSDMIVPFFVIGGFAGFQNKRFVGKLAILLLPLFLFGSQLIFFSLFPVNNMSLLWLGGLSLLIKSNSTPLQAAISAAALAAILFLSWRWVAGKASFSKLFTLSLIFFITMSIGSYYVGANKSADWLATEQMQLGKWLDNNTKMTDKILIDADGCDEADLRTQTLCSKRNHASSIGFWVNRKISVGQTNADYDIIITKKTLNLRLLKQTEGGIRVYAQ